MLSNLKLTDLLFVDVETAPMHGSYEELAAPMKTLWDKKAALISKNNETPAELYARAGIYAEFGKIICISIGFFYKLKGKRHFKLKSYYGDDEQLLLNEFADLLVSDFSKNKLLCAHNGKEFDFPYISRRMLINRIKLPAMLNAAGKKPWEIKHIDTLELWKFGDYKHYTSLELLAALFKIPSPKDDIDGSMIFKLYWEERDLPRIKNYCEKDVITLAQLILSYKGEALMDASFISFS